MVIYFSFSYLFKAAKLMLNYPTAIFKAFSDPQAASLMITNLRKKRYLENRVVERYLNGYCVSLNPADIDIISPSIAIDGWYSPSETELLKKIIGRGAVVVDVGANIGWFTLLSANIIGEKGRVLAFEPDPVSFSLLLRSKQKNAFENIQAFNMCASNKEGSQKLWLSSGNLGNHSTVRQVGDNSIDVRTVTLDKILEKLKIGIIDLLKVDVEGAEPEVIEGVQQYLLASKIKNIFLEWNPESWTTRKELVEIIMSKYNVYQFVRSPFLIKKLNEPLSQKTQRGNLFLRLSDRF